MVTFYIRLLGLLLTFLCARFTLWLLLPYTPLNEFESALSYLCSSLLARRVGPALLTYEKELDLNLWDLTHSSTSWEANHYQWGSPRQLGSQLPTFLLRLPIRVLPQLPISITLLAIKLELMPKRLPPTYYFQNTLVLLLTSLHVLASFPNHCFLIRRQRPTSDTFFLTTHSRSTLL